MKVFLLLIFTYGNSPATVVVPMQDLPACIKARDAVIEQTHFGRAYANRKICITEHGDVLEKTNE